MTDWYSWLYHYGVGTFFVVASYVVLLKSGAVRLADPRHRKLLASLVGGLLAFAAVHAVWNYFA